MLSLLWTKILYQPLYNGLIFLTSTVTLGDVGIAVVLLTIFVKIVLFPIQKKAIVSQMKMRSIQGELDAIKESGDDKQTQSKKTFELYKKNKVNPFSSCLVVLIQLPVIIALYTVFRHNLSADQNLLYSFVHFPEHLSQTLFGLIDLTAKKNIILALLAGGSQFFYSWLTIPPVGVLKEEEKLSVQKQVMRNMQIQTKYIMPVMIAVISFQVVAVLPLYWLVSNLASIAQELILRKKFKIRTASVSIK